MHPQALFSEDVRMISEGLTDVRRKRLGALVLAAKSQTYQDLSPYSESALKTQEWVTLIWHHVQPHLQKSHHIVDFLLKNFKASTANLYARTMATVFKNQTKTIEWQHALTYVGREARRVGSEGATPATASQVKAAMAKAAPQIQVLILLLWVTCSRFGDVAAMQVKMVESLGALSRVKVDLPVWKSDPNGRYHASKCFLFPTAFIKTLNLIIKEDCPSYYKLNNILKSVAPFLTPHSIRKGSMEYLAKNDVKEEDILIMTQHASPTAPVMARIYIKTPFLTQESQTQLTLSQMLLDITEPKKSSSGPLKKKPLKNLKC